MSKHNFSSKHQRRQRPLLPNEDALLDFEFALQCVSPVDPETWAVVQDMRTVLAEMSMGKADSENARRAVERFINERRPQTPEAF